MNKLKEIVSIISTKADVPTHYINHLPRAIAMTRMFNKGVPVKVIAEISGHTSLKAIQCYEFTSSELEKQLVT